MNPTDGRETAKARTAVALVLLWALVGPLRGYLVEAFRDGLHSDAPQYRGAWSIAFVTATAVFIGFIGLLKLRLERLDGDGPRYWAWWWAGAALVFIRVCASQIYSHHLDGASPPEWLMVGILLPLYSIGMVLLLLSGLNADPLTVFSRNRRDERPRDGARARSTLPIVIGVVMLLTANIIYFPTGPKSEIREDFFHEVLSLLPILLLALAIELKFFRGRGVPGAEPSASATAPDPVLRAAPIATGIMIAVAIVVAGSTFAYDDSRGASTWHKFIAFALSVQASTTALATVLLLAFNSGEDG